MRENKYIVSLAGEFLAERFHRANNPIYNRQIKVGKKSNMHVLNLIRLPTQIGYCHSPEDAFHKLDVRTGSCLHSK